MRSGMYGYVQSQKDAYEQVKAPASHYSGRRRWKQNGNLRQLS